MIKFFRTIIDDESSEDNHSLAWCTNSTEKRNVYGMYDKEVLITLELGDIPSRVYPLVLMIYASSETEIVIDICVMGSQLSTTISSSNLLPLIQFLCKNLNCCDCDYYSNHGICTTSKSWAC